MKTSETLQDRIALKKAIKNYKKTLKKIFEEVFSTPYVDAQVIEKMILGLRELSSLQKKLNATYIDGDEKSILERSQKRRGRST